MKNKKVACLVLSVLTMFSMSGCASLGSSMAEHMNTGQAIFVTVPASEENHAQDENLTWQPLGELTSFKEIRDSWDRDVFNNITFTDPETGKGSKNGVMYIDLDGKWTGNNTMFNAFNNYNFVKIYTDLDKKSELSVVADEVFSDITNSDAALI